MEPAGLPVWPLRYDRDERWTVVSLAGRADIAHVAWFARLPELPEAQWPGRIILDLSRLSTLDWWAALILLWAGRMVRRRGGMLVLASPQPGIARLLKTMDAAHVVAVYKNVQQAREHAHPSRSHEINSGRRWRASGGSDGEAA